MEKRAVLVTAGIATPVALAGFLVLAQYVRGQSGPGADEVAAGGRLYAEFCASCHGADLEGQPDWRSPDAEGRLPAPPHDETGHTWHHGDGLLFAYTKFGGKAVMKVQGLDFNSGMPGFADDLSDDEIRAILAFIKSRWPERHREMQAVRTEAERLRDEAGQ